MKVKVTLVRQATLVYEWEATEHGFPNPMNVELSTLKAAALNDSPHYSKWDLISASAPDLFTIRIEEN